MRAVKPQADTMARFRYAVAPEVWYEVAATLGILYGGFIGLPAAGAVWAAWKIAHGGY